MSQLRHPEDRRRGGERQLQLQVKLLGFNTLDEEKKNVREVLTLDEGGVFIP